MLRDVFGQPALVMQVDMPRAVYAQGASSVRYFTLSLARPGHRVRHRAQPAARALALPPARRHHRAGAAHAGRARRKLDPIAAGGRDELGLLAETINAGFSQLEATRTQQEIQAKNLSSTLAGTERPSPGPREVPRPPAAAPARERLSGQQPRHQGGAGPARDPWLWTSSRPTRSGCSSCGRTRINSWDWGRSSSRSPATPVSPACSAARRPDAALPEQVERPA